MRFTSAMLVAAATAMISCSKLWPFGNTPHTDAPANSIAITLPPLPTARSVFPPDSPWNQNIAGSPVDPSSSTLIDSCGGGGAAVHPDFGTVWEGEPIGIPYNLVTGSQPFVPMTFDYGSESDPGPYPVPPSPYIEGGPGSTGDRHILVIDQDNWLLYELYNAATADNGKSWHATAGARFDLSSDSLRPEGWASADAAGLPIFPGLVRYDEAVTNGHIPHALRFTCKQTRNAYVAPARHFAGASDDPKLAPMGLRLRLRSTVDPSAFPPSVRPIIVALQTYGMFLADNGGNLYLVGAPDARWNDAELASLGRLSGNDFDAVQTGPIGTKTR